MIPLSQDDRDERTTLKEISEKVQKSLKSESQR